MIISLLTAAVLSVVPAEGSNNATPLRLKGRTVALTASQLDVTCTTCRLVSRRYLGQSAQEPTPPPLLVPNEGVPPPPLIEADPESPPAGELTPPPDAPPWQGPPERKLAPKAQQLPSTYDNNTGEWVGKEALAGSLTLIVTDVAVGGAITAILIATIASSLGSNNADFVIGIFVAVALGLAHAVLSPLWCAIAVKAAADEPTANGLGGAALGAYLSAIGISVLSFGIVLAISVVASAGGGSAPTGVDAFGAVVSLGALLARWIGVPIASSWAMHRGEKRLYSTAPAAHPRKPIVITAAGREEPPLSGVTVVRF